LERWQAIAEQFGQPTLQWFSMYVSAGWELLHGHLDVGERLAAEAFQIGQEAGQPDAALIYGGHLSFIRSHQGRGQEIIEMQEHSVNAYPGIAAVNRAGLADSLCLLDRGDEARSILEQAANDGFQHVAPNTTSLGALALYSSAAARTRHIEAASALHERIEPFADQVVWLTSQGFGHVRLYLGLLASVLGKQAEAEEHLGFACEFHEANDIPLWAARGHLGWAETLAERGDPAGAREHATRALELSHEHGYGTFEPRASALLAAQPAAEG
jgi:tetratricopeptide (TPR) repeat protein